MSGTKVSRKLTTQRVGELTRLCSDLLRATGLPKERSNLTARLVLLADAWGETSHGVMRMPFYLDRLVAGGCRADAELVESVAAAAVVVLDGQAGIGHWQVWEAAQRATDRCLKTGICAVGVTNSSHCGALGAYLYPVVDAGLVGLVFSNGPAVMPPWGGTSAVLSTSPLAAGFPTMTRPIVADMALSAVARGKIAAAVNAGDAIPDGWAFSRAGTPTTDPREALRGMLAPFGGAKGYVLALIVEALTGGLLGTCLASDVTDMFDPSRNSHPQGISHLLVALDPRRFAGPGQNANRFDDLVTSILGGGGRLPGDGRIAPHELRDTTNVDIPAQVIENLTVWAERLGVTSGLVPADTPRQPTRP
jgi:(2R)-3-sulfolactate dehydrogenase (NADP+)